MTSGNPNMVQLLLDSDSSVNVNLRDSTGDTPIMYAAYGVGEGSNNKLICEPGPILLS